MVKKCNRIAEKSKHPLNTTTNPWRNSAACLALSNRKLLNQENSSARTRKRKPKIWTSKESFFVRSCIYYMCA